MAPQITLPENVSSARTNADALAKISGDYSSESYNIETELKRVVQEALDYNKDIIENSNRKTVRKHYDQQFNSNCR